jgi:3-oxoadipate enol-lactonase
VSGIQRPVLVIAGGLDEATPPQQSAQLHAAIAGSQLVTLKHAAHLSNVEEAGEFNDAVLKFLVVGQRC